MRQLSLLAGMTCSSAAPAQPLIEELQPLNFGTLAIASNTSISRFSLPRTGTNMSVEGQFALIAGGTPGRYRFTGFPANTALDVSLNSAVLTAGSNGSLEPLTVTDYDLGDVTTDAQGEAELALGAILDTTGNGNSYVDAPFSGTTLMRVDYWHPDVQNRVFNTSTIDLGAELRSTLILDEDQPLHFGTLFARTSTTAQATLTLSPSGSYTISEPDNSRLVSLAKPDLGIFRVSGAAANYSLTINPQTADVLLEHSEFPGSAPHFVLSSLTTLPDGTGITDANGELLVRLGGTLKTELTASPVTYPSGQYEGTYQLTVSY
ncbi:DUF4402 domain-containing protein [Granulosicoccus sp. 3-233]|uniref:DUF4402 domain-containing protein n=1 Tax=Granulosicoccus sp. 3-233 TaxID=3417969 RepID=UPI003D342D9B